jgi:serpin B
MNVATFAAAWLHPFAQASTADGPFTLPDGTVVQVPMMSQTLSTSYAESETWRAVELAFADGFVMDIAIAADGGSPAWTSVTDGLDDASEQSVHVVMPRWRAGTVIDLLPMLKGMGVGAIARPGNLDALYDAAFASAFAQGVTITVAEGGAVASAATEADVDGATEPTGTAVELVLDRPFEYHVVHEATGLVLFAGRVANPSV